MVLYHFKTIAFLFCCLQILIIPYPRRELHTNLATRVGGGCGSAAAYHAAPGTMPSDARVDFVYRPTYYAVAIMIKAAMRYPELIDASRKSEARIADGETLRRTLSACMLGSTGCGFMGHGYDDISGLVRTMEVFAMADTMGFITRYPELCPEFTELDRPAQFFV